MFHVKHFGIFGRKVKKLSSIGKVGNTVSFKKKEKTFFVM